MSNGFFIAFEGGEGSGKTTQINKLAESLANDGYKVTTTREPGGTPDAETIRDLVVQRGGGDWTPMAEMLLIYAAREMHLQQVIHPALEEGKIVLCDRFIDSTTAYQGYGHGLDLDIIQKIRTLVMGTFQPDLTLILDLEPEIGLQRSGRRLAAEELNIDQTEDRFENMDIDFHNRLRAGFLEIAKQEATRCHVVDAAQDIEAIQEQLYSCAKERLEQR